MNANRKRPTRRKNDTKPGLKNQVRITETRLLNFPVFQDTPVSDTMLKNIAGPGASPKAGFDPIAKEWDAFRKKPSASLPFFLPFCKGVVLDAGCGNGRNALALSSVATRVDAVDLSAEMVNRAEKNTHAEKNVTVAQADFSQLPFENGRFETVFCLAALHHVPSEKQEKVLREFRRVLKSGGFLCLTVWNKGQHRFRDKPKEVNVPWRGLARYYYFFDEEELAKKVGRAGFLVREIFYEKNGKKSSLQEGRNLCMIAQRVTT